MQDEDASGPRPQTRGLHQRSPWDAEPRGQAGTFRNSPSTFLTLMCLGLAVPSESPAVPPARCGCAAPCVTLKQRTACQCFTPSPCPGLTLERLRRRAACRAGPEEELPPPPPGGLLQGGSSSSARELRGGEDEGRAGPPPPTPHAKRSGVTGRRRGRGCGPDEGAAGGCPHG